MVNDANRSEFTFFSLNTSSYTHTHTHTCALLKKWRRRKFALSCWRPQRYEEMMMMAHLTRAWTSECYVRRIAYTHTNKRIFMCIYSCVRYVHRPLGEDLRATLRFNITMWYLLLLLLLLLIPLISLISLICALSSASIWKCQPLSRSFSRWSAIVLCRRRSFIFSYKSNFLNFIF